MVGIGLDDGAEAVGGVVVVESGLESGFLDDEGENLDVDVVAAAADCDDDAIPKRLATRSFKLRSSTPRSSSFLSSAAFQPSSAFGTKSRSPCT